MREVDMLEPLRHWLKKTNRIGYKTAEVREFQWLGRRIDFVTVTACGVTTAYEMKLRDNFCGIEQAAKNTHAFARSYLVTATMPSARNLALADNVGIGVLYLASEIISVLRLAPVRVVAEDITARLLAGVAVARNQSGV